MAGAVIAVLFGAYAAGGRVARRSAEIDRARQREKSLKVSRDVDEEISKMGPDDISDQLKSGWVRGNKKR